jgi:ABC-type lipoprotein release transport system permease subunit
LSRWWRIAAVAVAWPLRSPPEHSCEGRHLRDGLDISLSAIGIAGWLAISTALSVASSVVPATAAARRSIREAISYE